MVQPHIAPFNQSLSQDKELCSVPNVNPKLWVVRDPRDAYSVTWAHPGKWGMKAVNGPIAPRARLITGLAVCNTPARCIIDMSAYITVHPLSVTAPASYTPARIISTPCSPGLALRIGKTQVDTNAYNKLQNMIYWLTE